MVGAVLFGRPEKPNDEREEHHKEDVVYETMAIFEYGPLTGDIRTNRDREHGQRKPFVAGLRPADPVVSLLVGALFHAFTISEPPALSRPVKARSIAEHDEA